MWTSTSSCKLMQSIILNAQAVKCDSALSIMVVSAMKSRALSGRKIFNE